MNPTLRNLLFAVGIISLGGVGVVLFTPQPATRTMAELKDAGILDGQRLVVLCPERITRQTKRRVEANQPGLLRPKQSYAHIARTARCFNPDGGLCFRSADGLARIADLQGELVVPSLRRDLVGVDLDASVAEDGGDSDSVDDSFQYRLDDCEFRTCSQYDDEVDAGTLPNPFANAFCGTLNRLALVPSPCMLPNGWRSDGGWDESTPVDCKFAGPYGLEDGGPRWRGFNVGPAQYASGTECVPVECSVLAGDVPQEWL